jgi:hypothetical protein
MAMETETYLPPEYSASSLTEAALTPAYTSASYTVGAAVALVAASAAKAPAVNIFLKFNPIYTPHFFARQSARFLIYFFYLTWGRVSYPTVIK